MTSFKACWAAAAAPQRATACLCSSTEGRHTSEEHANYTHLLAISRKTRDHLNTAKMLFGDQREPDENSISAAVWVAVTPSSYWGIEMGLFLANIFQNRWFSTLKDRLVEVKPCLFQTNIRGKGGPGAKLARMRCSIQWKHQLHCNCMIFLNFSMFVLFSSTTSNEILSKRPTRYLNQVHSDLEDGQDHASVVAGRATRLWRSVWKGVGDRKEEWTTGRREAVNRQKSRSKFSSMTEKVWEAVRVPGKDPSVVKAVESPHRQIEDQGTSKSGAEGRQVYQEMTAKSGQVQAGLETDNQAENKALERVAWANTDMANVIQSLGFQWREAGKHMRPAGSRDGMDCRSSRRARSRGVAQVRWRGAEKHRWKTGGDCGDQFGRGWVMGKRNEPQGGGRAPTQCKHFKIWTLFDLLHCDDLELIYA